MEVEGGGGGGGEQFNTAMTLVGGGRKGIPLPSITCFTCMLVLWEVDFDIIPLYLHILQ